jgi:hypothetical protein
MNHHWRSRGSSIPRRDRVADLASAHEFRVTAADTLTGGERGRADTLTVGQHHR